MKRELRKVVCLNCGKNFETTILTKVYCSKECLKSAYRKIYEEKRGKTSFRIFRRDAFKCSYCGRTPYEDGIKLVVDHIYPVDKGGSGEAFNLITACVQCNLSKSSHILSNNLILELWQLNEKKNKEIPPGDFKELQEHFFLESKKRKGK